MEQRERLMEDAEIPSREKDDGGRRDLKQRKRLLEDNRDVVSRGRG